MQTAIVINMHYSANVFCKISVSKKSVTVTSAKKKIGNGEPSSNSGLVNLVHFRTNALKKSMDLSISLPAID